MHCISNLRKSALLMAIPVLLLSACAQKSDTLLNGDDDNGGFASDASRIEWANDDVISLADAAADVYNGAYLRTTHTTLGTCATVATDTVTVNAPHAIVIRFPGTDCKCLDGRNRRGQITITYNGRYTDSGQIHTITFNNYYINDVQLTGSIQTIRVDTTVTGNWYYQELVNDTLNMSQDPLKSQYIVWNGSLVRKWQTGFLSFDRGDDVYSISGHATLTRANGHAYTFDISSPIQIAMGCDYAEYGVVTVTGYQGSRVLNYGSGACDPMAQLNIGNNVYSINLTK